MSTMNVSSAGESVAAYPRLWPRRFSSTAVARLNLTSLTPPARKSSRYQAFCPQKINMKRESYNE
jgi:hypothetical protein